jgi:glycosyltransferase involved in cell wall biosynthesis
MTQITLFQITIPLKLGLQQLKEFLESMSFKHKDNQMNIVKQRVDILYDARHINNVYSGLGRYTASLLEGLLHTNDKQKSIGVLLDSSEDYSGNPHYLHLKPLMNAEGVIEHFVKAPLYGFQHHLKISAYVNRLQPDLFFYPHFDAPFLIKVPTIFVIHDLKTIILEDQIQSWSTLKRQYFSRLIKYNLNKINTHCVAISNHTRNDIIEQLHPKDAKEITVVYEDSFLKNTKPLTAVHGLKKPYLFYIGDRRPHKNLKRMIDIFSLLKTEFNYSGNFYIAGNQKNYEFNLEDYCVGRKDVILLPNLSDSELKFMYQEMEALFFLSRYEGFGLPVVEAANHNKKVITSNNSSLGEIAPETALLIDTDSNIMEAARKIISYLETEASIDNSKYLAQFSWEKSAKEIFFNNFVDDVESF